MDWNLHWEFYLINHFSRMVFSKNKTFSCNGDQYHKMASFTINGDIAAVKKWKTLLLIVQAFSLDIFNLSFVVRYPTRASENHIGLRYFDIAVIRAAKWYQFHRGQAVDRGKEMPGEMVGKYAFTYMVNIFCISILVSIVSGAWYMQGIDNVSLLVLRIIAKIGIPSDKYQKDWKSRLRREKRYNFSQIFGPELRRVVRWR